MGPGGGVGGFLRRGIGLNCMPGLSHEVVYSELLTDAGRP